MNLLVFSDLHMYNNFSRSYMLETGMTLWVQNQMKVVDQIKEYGISNKIHMMIFNGDLFEERSRIPQDLYNLTWDKFNELSKHFTIIMNTGNHDKTKITNNSLRPFSSIATIATEPIDFTSEDTIIRIIPYGMVNDESLKVPDTKHNKILFTHEDINGLTYGHNDCKSQAPLKKELFKDWGLVVNGHIHTPQKMGNIYNIGSCMKHEFGDESDRGFIHINNLNIKTIKTESPDFIKIEGLSTRIKNEILKDDYNFYRIDISPSELSDTIFTKYNIFPNIIKQNEIKEGRLNNTTTLEDEIDKYIQLSETNLDKNKLKRIGMELIC